MKNVHLLNKLNELLEDYLITGGFPNAIRDFTKYGRVSNTTMSDSISRSETFFKLTVKGIIERTSSELSFHTLSKSLGIGTVKTTISYVELLRKLYLLKVLKQVDLEGKVLSGKEKKFYFIDPFIYRAFSFWTLSELPDESKLIESVVISHLSRVYETFYTKVRGEVDAVIKDRELIGFEVKFGKVKAERKVLGRMKRVYVLSKDRADENVIPVSLFLSMLEVPQSIELRALS